MRTMKCVTTCRSATRWYAENPTLVFRCGTIFGYGFGIAMAHRQLPSQSAVDGVEILPWNFPAVRRTRAGK